MNDVLVTKEVATFFDIPCRNVYKLSNEGKIPFFRRGKNRTRFFDRKKLEKISIGNPNFKFKNAHWTKKDLELLKKSAGKAKLSWVAHKLRRTVYGVRNKMYGLGITQKNVQGEWTIYELMKTLGVCHRTIRKWIKSKDGLKARIVPFNGKKTFLINLKDLFSFFKMNPGFYDTSKLSEENRILLNLQDLPLSPTEKLLYCPHCKKKFWTSLEKYRCPSCGQCVERNAVKFNEKGKKLYRCQKCYKTYTKLVGLNSQPIRMRGNDFNCPFCNSRKIYHLQGFYR